MKTKSSYIYACITGHFYDPRRIAEGKSPFFRRSVHDVTYDDANDFFVAVAKVYHWDLQLITVSPEKH